MKKVTSIYLPVDLLAALDRRVATRPREPGTRASRNALIEDLLRGALELRGSADARAEQQQNN